ncbi:hypothetical protein VQH23_07415 [Pararoseomonas sp. SCSIO 73927]|uniref:hypothetical protein n=1 Tax=Pararoseomonas sp. SCSIO 73927 TaxID=3114537 RepID=UPI0030D51B51
MNDQLRLIPTGKEAITGPGGVVLSPDGGRVPNTEFWRRRRLDQEARDMTSAEIEAADKAEKAAEDAAIAAAKKAAQEAKKPGGNGESAA